MSASGQDKLRCFRRDVRLLLLNLISQRCSRMCEELEEGIRHISGSGGDLSLLAETCERQTRVPREVILEKLKQIQNENSRFGPTWRQGKTIHSILNDEKFPEGMNATMNLSTSSSHQFEPVNCDSFSNKVRELSNDLKSHNNRLSVRTTSDVDIVQDGYKWKKYGQKEIKGSSYPRRYYRCAAPGCTVRKQVERSAMRALEVISMYEGCHNHEPVEPFLVPPALKRKRGDEEEASRLLSANSMESSFIFSQNGSMTEGNVIKPALKRGFQENSLHPQFWNALGNPAHSETQLNMKPDSNASITSPGTENPCKAEISRTYFKAGSLIEKPSQWVSISSPATGGVQNQMTCSELECKKGYQHSGITGVSPFPSPDLELRL
eukprot:TRINITY_DN467_c0_g1_i1.p1 TRINITY_DN467_c0_g1~~TRINITY_DN467_c0_g1_i1.p1  ORF type:complete len:379 (+),score=25.64 TRINITY_DN467_c0_g1_i1:84-1220(+)